MSDKQNLREAMRDAYPPQSAPRDLAEWARHAAQAATLEDSNAIPEIQPASRHRLRVPIALYAAGLVAACALGWGANAAYVRVNQSRGDVLVAELVDNHVRSLMADHLVDVRSTDQHTVKPWFAGKTDFAPRVVDLAAAGFPLIGGRVEYIGGHDVAALVFARRRHFIDLYQWPATEADAQVSQKRVNGYTLVHWVADGNNYWAVSDASAADVEAFRTAFTASR